MSTTTAPAPSTTQPTTQPTTASTASPAAYHRPGASTSDGNVVWISVHKRLSFYRDIAVRMLAHHATVELRGLGAALAATVELAQHLIGGRRAELAGVRTGTSAGGERGGSKPEVVIVLRRVAGQSYNEDEEALISMTEDDTH